MTTSRARIPKHYRRPPLVQLHLSRAANQEDEDYLECAELLDSLIYDLTKIRYGYHIVADQHGPLYHVEVMDFISKLDIAMRKIERDE